MTIFNSIYLKNFKSYKDESFGLKELTVFCGNNSVGKSTAIQSLGLLIQSGFSRQIDLNGDLVHVGSVDDIHNHSNRLDETLSIGLTSDSDKFEWGYDGATERDIAREDGKLSLKSSSSNNLSVKERFKNNKYQFIVAERYGPRDNLSLSNSKPHRHWLGTKGEFVVEVLNYIVQTKEKHLSLLGDDPRKHSKSSKYEVSRQVQNWMSEISPGYSFEPTKIDQANVAYNSITPRSGEPTKPINIGFGYSYALSVVTALLISDPDDVVVLENPEAHLHPRGQSYLGRLIALTAKAGVQVIVETHSDHLLNGIRVVARTDESFDPSIFNLYYISQPEEDSKVEKISLTKDGKLSNWPEGFFDQQAQDMYTIMTGQTQLPNKGA